MEWTGEIVEQDNRITGRKPREVERNGGRWIFILAETPNRIKNMEGKGETLKGTQRGGKGKGTEDIAGFKDAQKSKQERSSLKPEVGMNDKGLLEVMWRNGGSVHKGHNKGNNKGSNKGSKAFRNSRNTVMVERDNKGRDMGGDSCRDSVHS